MDKRRKVLAGFLVLALGVAWAISPVTAGPILYLGDARTDGIIDSADVIRVYRAVIGEEMPPALAWLLADANNDFTVDERDVDYVVNIILGTAIPNPLAGEVASVPVSFFLLPEPPNLQATESVQQGVASFFYLAEVIVPPAAEQDVVQKGSPSFFYLTEVLVPAATDVDVVQKGSPSFFYIPQVTVPEAVEHDAVQRGTPSFFYLPIVQYTVDETNSVELGTPSFDRQ